MWYNIQNKSGLPVLSINGPATVAYTTRSFSVGTILGATYTWSSSPNVQIVSQSNGTVNVQAVNGTSGEGWIDVNVTTPYGNFCLNKFVQICPPISFRVTPDISTGYCPLDQVQLYVSATSPTTTYVWTISGDLTVVSGLNTSHLTVNLKEGFRYGVVQVRAFNSCGVEETASRNFSLGSYCSNFSYSVYHNPAEEDVEIAADEGAESNLAAAEAFEVEVYDQMGIQRMIGKTYQKKEKLKLKVKDLAPGSYILHIIHSQGVVQKHLQIH